MIELDFEPPLDWNGLTHFFGQRRLIGIETVSDQAWARSYSSADGPGWLRVVRRGSILQLTIDGPGEHPDTVRRCRELFDLDASPAAIAAQLGEDELLGGALRTEPGLRVPGSWDLFELAVRAVLGQQVSVAAATTIANRLCERYGEPFDCPLPGIDRLFPQPCALCEQPLEELGLPGQRAATLRRVAAHFAAQPQATAESLRGMRGIGPWTLGYLQLRGGGHRDAFPSGDIVLQRMCSSTDAPMPARELDRLARRWSPYRSYAVIALWRTARQLADEKKRARQA